MKFEKFENIFTDSTSKYSKIKKEDYLPYGKFPIIDQGKEFIGGYTNNESLVSGENLPVIIFGDHTKAFKYVDFPFTIGADGVKVLTLKNNSFNALYFFHFLKGIKITDAGYSRHFKYLKEKSIPVPEKIQTQLHIAKILSQAEGLIAQRRESICLLDEYLKSVFLEMFGDPVRNEKGWKKTQLGKVLEIRGRVGWKGYKKSDLRESGPLVLGATHLNERGDLDLSLPVYISKEKFDESPEIVVERNDIIIVQRGNTIGKIAHIKENIGDATINPCVLIMRTFKVEPLYIKLYFLNSKVISQLWKMNNASAQPMLTQGDLKSFEILMPPVSLQTQFAQIVEKTEALKAQYQQSLHELENLYGSLSQRAFRGELNPKDGEVKYLEGLESGVAAEPKGSYKR